MITLFAAAATFYMMTKSKTCVLESQFGLFMSEYRNFYNSEAE